MNPLTILQRGVSEGFTLFCWDGALAKGFTVLLETVKNLFRNSPYSTAGFRTFLTGFIDFLTKVRFLPFSSDNGSL